MPTLINPWILLAGLVLLISSYFAGHHKGYADSQSDVLIAASKAKAGADKREQARIIDEALHETDYLTRIKALQDQTNESNSKLKGLTDALGSCRLGLTAVRLYNNAATGLQPPAPDARTTGAAASETQTPSSVTCQDVVLNANDNFGICRANATQLEALQGWYNRLRESVNANR